METKPNEPIHLAPPKPYRKEFLGLTKREWFAAMALQGLTGQSLELFKLVPDYNIAKSAVEYADNLIEALNKEPNAK